MLSAGDTDRWLCSFRLMKRVASHRKGPARQSLSSGSHSATVLQREQRLSVHADRWVPGPCHSLPCRAPRNRSALGSVQDTPRAPGLPAGSGRWECQVGGWQMEEAELGVPPPTPAPAGAPWPPAKPCSAPSPAARQSHCGHSSCPRVLGLSLSQSRPSSPTTGLWGFWRRRSPGVSHCSHFARPVSPALSDQPCTLNPLRGTTWCGSCSHAWSPAPPCDPLPCGICLSLLLRSPKEICNVGTWVLLPFAQEQARGMEVTGSGQLSDHISGDLHGDRDSTRGPRHQDNPYSVPTPSCSIPEAENALDPHECLLYRGFMCMPESQSGNQ